MDNWNDLQLVLAISRGRTLGDAARSLSLNHSTVFRNLNAIEARLGARLFERLPGGVYEPTALGQRAASAAERVETEMLALGREVAGRDSRLVGRLVVTSSETLAYRVLVEEIASFGAMHPGIQIELAIDNRVLDLSRREADIALRVTRPREPDLFGRKLADIAWAIYGVPELVDGPPVSDAAELRARPFVGWASGTRGVVAANWLSEVLAPRDIRFRSTSLISQYRAALAGMGLALLPCYLGDLDPCLVRAVAGPLPDLTRELWIVTHEDLKATARVKAFLEIVGAGLGARKDMFAGRTPPAATP